MQIGELANSAPIGPEYCQLFYIKTKDGGGGNIEMWGTYILGGQSNFWRGSIDYGCNVGLIFFPPHRTASRTSSLPFLPF